jgi:ATP-dependent RNA circularization protein (DNA/RNA ligase family)
MTEYHKITTLFKRDPKNMRFVFEGQWAEPELEWLKDNEWIFTEKVDGTNIRVMWNGEKVSFGGKTDNAQIYVPLLNKLAELFDTTPKRKLLREKFASDETPTDVCLYGEGYGARIQKGGGNYKKDDVDFVLFDVKIGDWWLKREDVEDIAVTLGIKVVPIVGNGTLLEAVELVKGGLKSQWGDFPAEGLVCRPAVELKNRRGYRIITKIKARDFKV